MFRRRQVKTHAQMMRDELGVGVEHLRQAAAHAAGGTADFVAPRVGAARRAVKPKLRAAKVTTLATIMPLAEATRDRAWQTGKAAGKSRSQLSKKTKISTRENAMTGKRWPLIIGGMLVAGTAAGLAGAVIVRRRANRSRWEEYGAAEPTTDRQTDARSMMDSAKSTVESGVDKVHSIGEAVRDRAADMVTKTGEPAGRSTASTRTTPTSASSSVGTSTSPATTAEYGIREDVYKAGSASRNSRT